MNQNQNDMRRDTVKTIRRRILPVDSSAICVQKDTSNELIVQAMVMTKDSLPKKTGKKLIQMPVTDSVTVSIFANDSESINFHENQKEKSTDTVEIMNHVQTAFSPFSQWTIQKGKEHAIEPVVKESFLSDPFFYLMVSFTVMYLRDCYIKRSWKKLGRDLSVAWA